VGTVWPNRARLEGVVLLGKVSFVKLRCPSEKSEKSGLERKGNVTEKSEKLENRASRERGLGLKNRKIRGFVRPPSDQTGSDWKDECFRGKVSFVKLRCPSEKSG
jgi:hypothetical protein